tara:strand:+ start:216 stop:752 length:537 start_codon:yes stop_codon:yes gene_type:complete
MNRNVGIATAIGIGIIIVVIAYQINETTHYVTSPEDYEKSIGTGSVSHVVYPDNPQILGPLQINKDKYLLGENIFAILTNLQPGDKGAVLFFTPTGVLYDEWEFNADVKNSQKKYFKPQLLKGKNLCDKNDLIGDWTVMFRSYEMSKLNFEITSDILPGMEYQYIECEIAYEIDITAP